MTPPTSVLHCDSLVTLGYPFDFSLSAWDAVAFSTYSSAGPHRRAEQGEAMADGTQSSPASHYCVSIVKSNPVSSPGM